MCQVHAGTYVALLAPEKTDYTACHPEKIVPRIYYTRYLSPRIRTSGSSQLEKRKERKRREKKGKDKRKTIFGTKYLMTMFAHEKSSHLLIRFLSESPC